MKHRTRVTFLFVAVCLPMTVKRSIYQRVFGWSISRSARIGFSYLDAAEVIIGDGVTIGHLNAIRGLRRLVVGDDCHIRNRNEMFGAGENPAFPSTLVFGAGCHVMSLHFIDASGGVRLGPRTTVAGRGSKLWSHSETRSGGRRLVPTPINVGSDSYIGAGATLIGVRLPNQSVVAAAASIAGDKTAQGPQVWIGNPAKQRHGT